MNNKIIENLEKLKKMLVLLSEDRKVVLSHHKTFEHVEKINIQPTVCWRNGNC